MIVGNELVISSAVVYKTQSGHAVPVLNHIDLRIAAGEWVNIVGPNGSGKSTLAQLIAGIQSIHSGNVDRGFLPDVVPYVMQHNYFFGETPWEDIIFQLEMRGEEPQQIPHIAHQALVAVGLENLKYRPFTELSGGQKQLAAIAGCIAAKAPLLLLDEATSMLDSSSRMDVLKAVQTIHRQGASVIWLTHHMEELVDGTRVIGMKNGKIMFDGKPASFFYGCEAAGVSDSQLQSDDPEMPPQYQEQRSSDQIVSTVSQLMVSKPDSQVGLIPELHSGLTPCEMFGFEPPYPVQVARELFRQGIQLDRFPITPEQLVEAVHEYAR
ncbi:Energy-coupling factor transporter ATP-binding protein EcfA2 [Paenibacillus sp. 1_12]|uniref:energy-coupling factor ABC transporter ATP-binding protein n=1 Tax=Paenibacillus sp. 1_12 TaxID=1566278 RepID=UPI0008DF5A63|nr:ATP-binding cassette domain-containing protein [Paenibacillus sp. 1_12]SFL34253.1 Energy-coupling factor transporter ATP-binding protein EcfA2 [Paenibacillus sp. 1_12]